MDGGNTHNFIQEELVTKLRFSSRETSPLWVMVGNRQHLECTHRCEAVTIEIQTTKFIIDLYVLPISGANIVLGVQWLKSLGPVLTDYNTLCMKFFHDGRLVELKGDRKSTLSSLSPPQFCKMLRKQSMRFYYRIAVLANDSFGEDISLLSSSTTYLFTTIPSMITWLIWRRHFRYFLTINSSLNYLNALLLNHRSNILGTLFLKGGWNQWLPRWVPFVNGPLLGPPKLSAASWALQVSIDDLFGGML